MTRRVSTTMALASAALIALFGLGCSSSDGDGGGAGSGGSGASGGSGGSGGSAGMGGMAGAGGMAGDGGTAGDGGSAGGGGMGGGSTACDDLNGRPVLTAQPSVTPTDPVGGSELEVDLEVSADTRVVRIRIFDGFSNIGGEATVMPANGGSLTVTVDLVEDPTNFDYFLGILLCNADNTDCTTNNSASTVSYTRPGSTSGEGDPYFASVRDDGVSIPAESKESCYDLVVFNIASP